MATTPMLTLCVAVFKIHVIDDFDFKECLTARRTIHPGVAPRLSNQCQAGIQTKEYKTDDSNWY